MRFGLCVRHLMGSDAKPSQRLHLAITSAIQDACSLRREASLRDSFDRIATRFRHLVKWSYVILWRDERPSHLVLLEGWCGVDDNVLLSLEDILADFDRGIVKHTDRLLLHATISK